ncbi:MAG: hypothetical protein PHW24_03770 [Candidatus Moranbacteria bacterium]|nr:hypothetical protein [Candidatus Moranbacteria bacterium]
MQKIFIGLLKRKDAVYPIPCVSFCGSTSPPITAASIPMLVERHADLFGRKNWRENVIFELPADLVVEDGDTVTELCKYNKEEFAEAMAKY